MIRERCLDNGLRFIDIETDLCAASLCLQGAHLTNWKPTGQEEIFYVSPIGSDSPGKAIRGGIPLCWPWFGKREGFPSHGLARTSLWHLEKCEEDRGVFNLSLSFSPDDYRLPSAFLSVKVGASLEMSLQTIARDEAYTLTNAFHNYFRTGDVAQCRISGLEKMPFNEFATHQGEYAPSHSAVVPYEALDRIYAMSSDSGEVCLHDDLLNRSIHIRRESSHSVIVWNPWDEGSLSIFDLPDDGWRSFLCIEPGNTGLHGIRLAPGQAHCLKQTIFVSHLS